MARVRKTKPTLETVLFVTPEQKLLRLLLSECTTSFTSRVLSSKLKGVRGLGGVEGINKILRQLNEVGLVNFLDNGRSACLHNEAPANILMKRVAALCDLEGLREQLEPISKKMILYGSRARGEARSDSNYDLFIVSDQPIEVEKVVTRHPLSKRIGLEVWSDQDYLNIESKNPDLAERLAKGILIWGSTW